MEEFLSQLSSKLKHISHEYIKDTVVINCVISKDRCNCPYCGNETDKVDRKYLRTIKDIAFGNKKVMLKVKFKIIFV